MTRLNPELDLKAASEAVKVVAKRVQLECEHISVKQLASVPARRICQSCDLEEESTRGSSWITAAYWRHDSFQAGELDNDGARGGGRSLLRADIR